MFDPQQTVNGFLSIVLTHNCNKNCPFCIDSYKGRDENISLENVKKAINFAQKNSIRDILLIGGEPTLHPEILEISKEIEKEQLRTILTTNYTKPEIIQKLDGVVDCFNISYYNQKTLPEQKNFKSDLTLTTITHQKQLETKEKLDNFIDIHQKNSHLKFSTLTNCNSWTQKHQTVEYLDALDCEYIILFNELLGQKYRNCIIKRQDKIINNFAQQSFKMHVDGTLSKSWNREKL
jgi:organic radical activating enzyme